MNVKKLLSIGLLLVFLVSASAQQGVNNKRKERVKSLRIAFLTNEMDLTPTEAEVFWPIYNEMEKKISTIKRQTRIKYKNEDFDDEEIANELIQLRLSSEQEILDLKKEYVSRMIVAVSARKIILLKNAEDQFKKELLKEVRKRNKK